MKVKMFLACALCSFALASCIQDEALNSEAAIDQCTGNNVQSATISWEDRTVDLYLSVKTDLSNLDLEFTIPQGATLEENGEPKAKVLTVDRTHSVVSGTFDFSAESATGEHVRTFTVISEDGTQKPVYTVRALRAELPLKFDFENIAPNNAFDILTQGPTFQWASGNPGFQLTGMANSPVDYPTLRWRSGFQGNCVKLVTCNTGSFGAMVKMYIAAGNLFVGRFDLANALTNAPKATKFGFAFYKKPLRLTGYYKYKAGSEYSEKGQVVSGKKDTGDIYAILYEADKDAYMIDGEWETTPAQKSTFVALARMQDAGGPGTPEADEWTPFSLDFAPYEGRTIDEQKLINGGYKLAIVFSSSLKGAMFEGALGSTLYIDEVEIKCED
ncbi:MAG: PCMD domain-containing protein [Mediterranea sp.]|jgi:hypothetical protein|nr:PCMD domain-containing protein [Mediterranea sp.]